MAFFDWVSEFEARRPQAGMYVTAKFLLMSLKYPCQNSLHIAFELISRTLGNSSLALNDQTLLDVRKLN